MGTAKDRNDGLWVEMSDRLFVAAYSSVASLVVRFSGYYRKANEEISEYAFDVEPTSDRAATTKDFFIGEGFLLSCMATLSSGNANRGQCYVRAHIQRNTGAAAVKLHRVISGYVTDDNSPSFPYGVPQGPLDGPGMLRSVTGTNPAAGAEITDAVPTGARWRLSTVSASFVADANVANRRVRAIIDDGTLEMFRYKAAADQTAGQTNQYTFAPLGSESAIANNVAIIPIPPDCYMFAGWRFVTSTVNLQVGDNWGAPQYLVEEWIET